ncbi:MAG TPA: MBL fold metallo-hydrolase [Candidatus Ozemobacteraceae bacterium]|nr:MBL fold metallo-hydrolase [Candidatus Ozemobacteraceae bacterium]
MKHIQRYYSKYNFICLILLVGLCAFVPVFAQKADAGPQKNPLQPGWLEAAFIDVGKGDAAIIRFPDGRSCLIDTGYADTSETVIRNLKKRGLTSLDLIVITHDHKDHAGGYPAIVREFPTARVIQPFDSRDDSHTLRVKPGEVLIAGKGFALTALGPSRLFTDENDSSLVLNLAFGTVSFLFAGDILAEGQADLLKRCPNLKADVLKVPHHGTFKKNSATAFFTAVKPAYAVITCDSENGDVPDQGVAETLQGLGTTVLRTDMNGNIVFRSDGTQLIMKP